MKKKKKCFFLLSQGSFNTKMSFLGQKVCPVVCLRTHRGTLSGFQDVFLQPIIKDRPNISLLFIFLKFQLNSRLLFRIYFLFMQIIEAEKRNDKIINNSWFPQRSTGFEVRFLNSPLLEINCNNKRVQFDKTVKYWCQCGAKLLI